MNLYRANNGMESLVTGITIPCIIIIAREISRYTWISGKKTQNSTYIAFVTLYLYQDMFLLEKRWPSMISIIDRSSTDTVQVALSLLWSLMILIAPHYNLSIYIFIYLSPTSTTVQMALSNVWWLTLQLSHQWHYKQSLLNSKSV